MINVAKLQIGSWATQNWLQALRSAHFAFGFDPQEKYDADGQHHHVASASRQSEWGDKAIPSLNIRTDFAILPRLVVPEKVKFFLQHV